MDCPDCGKEMLHEKIGDNRWAWCCYDCEINIKDRWRNEAHRED
jgi:hypothetical protein